MTALEDAVGKAISEKNFDHLIPFIRKEDQKELRDAFDLAVHARTLEDESKSFADEYLLETAIRLHSNAEEGTA